MPLPVLADTFQVVIDWAATGGQTAKNVMYFATTSSGDDASLATALDANTSANMFHTISSEAAAATCSIRPMDGVSAPQPFPLTSWVGTEGEEWVPATACCLTLYTAVAGRSNRGRLYLPFTAESVQDDGLFIGDASTVVTPAWNDFISAMGGDDWEMVVASLIEQHTHTVHNGDGSVTRGVPTGAAVPHTNPVTRIAQQVVVATQRRRQSRLRTS